MVLPERLARRVAMLALALLLAACGPGTGGTGTGPRELVTFSGGAAAVSVPGMAVPCAGPCQSVDLRLEDDRVELTTDCRRFVSSGRWEADAGGLVVVNGSLEVTSASGTGSVPATLRLQFDSANPAASQSVSILLVDGADRPLLGPVILQRRSAAAATPPACVVK